MLRPKLSLLNYRGTEGVAKKRDKQGELNKYFTFARAEKTQ